MLEQLDIFDYINERSTDDIELFKNHEIKARELFDIREITKKEALELLTQYHYLGEKDFIYSVAYGLFIKNATAPIGCAVFGSPSGARTVYGWFGVGNEHSMDYLELTRLVVSSTLNGCNATSYLLGNSIKLLRKKFTNLKAVISLADASIHVGGIYQACNFKYYGMTSKKADFYLPSGKCPSRVKPKGMHGVHVARTRKHRYCYIIDKTVTVKYHEQPYPKELNTAKVSECCNGTHVVYDKRFNEWYTCPKCTEEFRQLTEEEALAYTAVTK